MAVAGKLTYETDLNKNGFEKGLNSLKNVTSTSIKAISAGITVATTAVAGLVTASVKGYAEYEQLVGGVDTLFKTSSQKVQEYANNAYKTAGMSANKYMETVTSFSASLLQSLDGDTEKAADVANMAITDMSDNANKMGTDIAMIQNAYQGFAKQNYTMLDNLKLGYGGTKTEMERLLKDATAISGVKYDISSLNDVYQAIHVIQGELGITGTTAKEASTTISGSISSMKSAWDNLLVGITNPNANLDVLIQQLVDSVVVAGENILPAIESALNGVNNLIGKLFPIIAQKIPEILTNILPKLVENGMNIIKSLSSGIEENLPNLISSAIEIIMTIVNGLIDLLPQILEMGIKIILELILGISKQLPTLIPKMVECIMLMVETLVDNIDLIIDAGFELIIGLITGIVDAIPKLIEKIPVIIEKLVVKLTEPESVEKLIKATIMLMFGMQLGLIKAIPQIVEAIPKIISSIVNHFKNYDWGSLGKNLLQGLLNGFSNASNVIWQAIRKVCNSMIGSIKSFFGIHSPSRVFAELGKFLPQGFAVGIEADTDSALNAIENMNDEIINKMNRAVEVETNSINSEAGIKSNNNLANSININLKNGIQSIENNREIVVNSVTNLDSKVLTNAVNKVKTMQKLQYGLT